VTDAAACFRIDTAVVGTTPLPATVADIIPSKCLEPTGSATINVEGGTLPYSYLWSDGNTTQTVQNIISGYYTVTATDAMGCTATADANIWSTPLPVTVADIVNARCMQPNGSAIVYPDSGTAPYNYHWSNDQTAQKIQNVINGTYYVTITDASGCTATTEAVIGNTPLPLTVADVIDAMCGRTNGSATVNADSGTAPYNYHWSNNQTTQQIQNVASGTYSVTVTDAMGCTATTTATIANSPLPTSAPDIDSASCGQADGRATITASDGTPPYTYMWDIGQTTDTLINAPTGNYIVTITDSLGCTATATVFIPERPGPSAVASSTDEICNRANATAIVVAHGGTGTYTYAWSDNSQQTTDTAVNLQAGTYAVIVSDGYCNTIATVIIDNIPPPSADFYFTPKVATIFEGAVTFLDNSSGNNIRWLWDFGEGSSGDSGKVVQHDYQNVGTYYVTLSVTDINNCTDTITHPIRVKDIFTFYIPNAFSPNGDGINDFFFPQGTNIDPDNYEMYIFDRWGNIMFHTNTWLGQTSEAWNGTKFNSGTVNDIVIDVYVYRIKVKELEGIKHEYIGRIALIQ